MKDAPQYEVTLLDPDGLDVHCEVVAGNEYGPNPLCMTRIMRAHGAKPSWSFKIFRLS